MKFKYNVSCNIKIGDRFYAIIKDSTGIIGGVYEIYVYSIDYNNKIVDFSIKEYETHHVSSSFYCFNYFVFDNIEDAYEKFNSDDFDYDNDGLE